MLSCAVRPRTSSASRPSPYQTAYLAVARACWATRSMREIRRSFSPMRTCPSRWLTAGARRVRMGSTKSERGASATEFIKSKADGRIFFLETSARVGGAHIAELVEAATGLNLWAEWAKVDVASGDGGYRPPVPNQDYAALLISLSRQEHPDTDRKSTRLNS